MPGGSGRPALLYHRERLGWMEERMGENAALLESYLALAGEGETVLPGGYVLSREGDSRAALVETTGFHKRCRRPRLLRGWPRLPGDRLLPHPDVGLGPGHELLPEQRAVAAGPLEVDIPSTILPARRVIDAESLVFCISTRIVHIKGSPNFQHTL